MNEQISTIETKRIVANPNNPRTRIEDVSDLVASIRENGLMQPIIVRWTKQKDEDGIPTGYEVIAGSRRLTACQQLGIEKISCIVRTCDDDKAFELATTENLVRENMNPADEARAVAKLFKEGKGRIEVGAIFGKSGRWAEGRRRIANLGDKALEMLQRGTITLGHAEVLTMCDEDRIEYWLDSARWRKPEELRREILAKDRRLLQKAPFNYKKICAKCPKRSDCQMDLFGEMKETYCLDQDCYERQIEKECQRLENSFQKAGYKPIPEEELYDAQYEYGPYINASTEDEEEKETIKEWKKKGAKALFWINRKTAESGLVFRDPSVDEEESDDETASQDSKYLSWDEREKIHEDSRSRQSEDIQNAIKKYIDKLDEETTAFFLTVIDDDARFESAETDSEGNERSFTETPMDHVGEEFEHLDDEEKKISQKNRLIKKIAENLLYYDRVEDCIMKSLGLKTSDEYDNESKEKFLQTK